MCKSSTMPSDEKQAQGMVTSSCDDESSKHSLSSLVARTRIQPSSQSLFELERSKLLRINLKPKKDNYAWIKLGCIIARQGDLNTSRQSMREQGLGKIVKKAVSGEGMNLIKCKGDGIVFCADDDKLVSLVHLHEQTLFLNGNDVLALSPSLSYDFALMKGAHIASGSVFNIKVSGTGIMAFTSRGDVVTLEASPENPVYTDPNSTVAWTHQPSTKMALSMKSIVGRGSGEEVQFEFKGGVVIVQPFEEVPVSEPMRVPGTPVKVKL